MSVGSGELAFEIINYSSKWPNGTVVDGSDSERDSDGSVRASGVAEDAACPVVLRDAVALPSSPS